jgi:hypothetical protein
MSKRAIQTAINSRELEVLEALGIGGGDCRPRRAHGRHRLEVVE